VLLLRLAVLGAAKEAVNAIVRWLQLGFSAGEVFLTFMEVVLLMVDMLCHFMVAMLALDVVDPSLLLTLSVQSWLGTEGGIHWQNVFWSGIRRNYPPTCLIIVWFPLSLLLLSHLQIKICEIGNEVVKMARTARLTQARVGRKIWTS
jgi:hypothetical protein